MYTPDGDVVVLTGANEGIGHHMLRTFIDDGYRVAALDVDTSNLGDLAGRHPDRLLVRECDVTVDADVEGSVAAVVDRWGRVDYLVNNAAVFSFAPFADQTIDDTRREFEVNYFGYVRLIRAVLPHMRARNAGVIHNVSSGVTLHGHPGLSGYSSTKGTVEALTKSLRQELRHEDVACTLMYPALTATRSAKTIGYPESLMADPATVGRKLARQVTSRGPVIYADWQTRLGMALTRRFPFLVTRGTERFVEPPARVPESDSESEPESGTVEPVTVDDSAAKDDSARQRPSS